MPSGTAGVRTDHSLVFGIAATSASLLVTELALTRIFSVTMFYHFAFLAISIALFGLSASGVTVYVLRRPLSAVDTRSLLCGGALLHSLATLVALGVVVHLHIGLTVSRDDALAMLGIYLFAALPFFAGGAVLSVAFSRLTEQINTLYAADLVGAALGCLAVVPLLDRLGATGAVLTAAGLAAAASIALAPAARRVRMRDVAVLSMTLAVIAQAAGLPLFEVGGTKGHEYDRTLFSKWNSFSRVGVYDRAHADWSLSPRYTGPRPASLVMDIDSSASTPILKGTGNPADAAYLRYELTAIAYSLVGKPQGFTALVIGSGGGRDILSALVFGARHVDGVEINPIIARDVMQDRFRDYSGNLYGNSSVSIHIEDGRSFVRRSTARFDVIQASLVDTWAATAAGAYTLTENSLYTVEAFRDYLDHLTPDGVLTVTRWLAGGLRLVSLAQAACAQRGIDCARHIALVSDRNVVTFILKRSPFSAEEARSLKRRAEELGFDLLYAPGATSTPIGQEPPELRKAGMRGAGDYRDLVLSTDPARFIAEYPFDISPTTDDRPFFFSSARLHNQWQAVFRHGPLGSGLSALLFLLGLSGGLVLLFVVGPLLLAHRRPGAGWSAWLAYFAALGGGFMLLEVALLQRFVLLLGHPVYSLTVTLFSLLLGTGLGSLIGRRISIERVKALTLVALLAVAAASLLASFTVEALVELAIPWPLPVRACVAAAMLVPLGAILGMCLPGGMRLLHRVRPEIVAWAWGMNGALSVLGATLAIFVAMSWGYAITLQAAAAIYLAAAAFLALGTRPSRFGHAAREPLAASPATDP